MKHYVELAKTYAAAEAKTVEANRAQAKAADAQKAAATAEAMKAVEAARTPSQSNRGQKDCPQEPPRNRGGIH